MTYGSLLIRISNCDRFFGPVFTGKIVPVAVIGPNAASRMVPMTKQMVVIIAPITESTATKAAMTATPTATRLPNTKATTKAIMATITAKIDPKMAAIVPPMQVQKSSQNPLIFRIGTSTGFIFWWSDFDSLSFRGKVDWILIRELAAAIWHKNKSDDQILTRCLFAENLIEF